MEITRDIYLKSAGVLAFVGDSVFSVLVRTHLAQCHDLTAGKLNRLANKLVCAKAQAQMLDRVYTILDETEQDIVGRARNISPNNVPKSSSIEEYSKATALESLFGYWHMVGDRARLEEVFNLCVGDSL